MEAWRQRLLGGRKTFASEKETRIYLTPTGLLMEALSLKFQLLSIQFSELRSMTPALAPSVANIHHLTREIANLGLPQLN
jgi:hypothetical protein